MFNRIPHRTQSTFNHAQPTFHNENEDYTNRIPPISFKNSTQFGKAPSTDRLARSISSEYGNQGSQLLKNSLSNTNLHEGMCSLARSQEGNLLRFSQSNGLGSSMSSASIKMGMKSSVSRQMMAVDRRLKNEVLDNVIKSSIRGSQMTQSIRVNEIPCSSQDGKRAKYQLVNSNDPQNMFYCSKCSIALIQQGYKVEEISSNKIDTIKRRNQCQELLQRLETSEDKLRQEIVRLEGQRYTHALQERMHKVEEIYDIIILIIQQMKAKDVETTKRSMEQAHRIRLTEINILQKQLEKTTEIKHYIQGIMNHALRELPEPQYRSLLEHNIHLLKETQGYKPLVLLVKDEPVEKILQTIFSQIGEHFQSMRIGGGPLSSVSSQIIEQQSDDFTLSDLKQKPFRNLFTEEDLSFNR